MDKKDVLNIIFRFRDVLEKKNIHIKRIILYGSWAKNTQREDSDIDLVVLSDDFKNKGYWERIDILVDAIYKVFAPIEVIGMSLEEWEKGESFVVDYAKDGEVVYDRDVA